MLFIHVQLVSLCYEIFIRAKDKEVVLTRVGPLNSNISEKESRILSVVEGTDLDETTFYFLYISLIFLHMYISKTLTNNEGVAKWILIRFLIL
jgi:hypothetical protein